MKEIEVKILGIDPDDIRKKLHKLGAEKLFDGLLKVRYFDTPNGEIHKKGELLRIREYGGKKVEITHKTNKRIENGFKIYDEQNIQADNFEEATKMLKELGFEVTTYYEKKRAIFRLDDAEIVIDEYPKIPPFIEIEAENSKIIDDIIKKLGLQKNEKSSATINEFIKEKYPEISLNNLTF